jgi:hypothetical protein
MLTVQNAVIVALVFAFAAPAERLGRPAALALALALALAALGPLALEGAALSALYAGQMVMYLASRLPQIAANASAGHTGTLAPLTLAMSFAGAAARLFTVLQEVPDVFVRGNAVLVAVLNGTLMAQWTAYRRATADMLALEARKRAGESGENSASGKGASGKGRSVSNKKRD